MRGDLLAPERLGPPPVQCHTRIIAKCRMVSLYDVIADSCAALAAKAKHKSDKVQASAACGPMAHRSCRSPRAW